MRQLKINFNLTDHHDEALSKYLNEIARIPSITINEEIELAQQIRQGSQEAKDKLVKANLRFVVSVAKQYQHHGLPLIDLINEGNIGLMTAADKYDETRGFKFISYAVWWVRQRILHAILEQGRTIRLPQNENAMLGKINRFIEQFTQENYRVPTNAEIADALDIKESLVQRLTVHSPLSIDAPLTDDDMTIADTLQAEPQPDIASLNSDLSAVLSQVLTPREIDILYRFFGINYMPQTYDSIALELGLSRERVRQIKEKSLEKARQYLDLFKKYVA